MEDKFYLVMRPSFKGTTMPVYYYTFAKDETEAEFKIGMKWGGIDDKTQVKEIKGDDLKKIVIATDYFG
jgi:hypothetical protein